jgi:hypothetical protein
MDSVVNYVAGALGISPVTLVLLLGTVVAVCNLVGKLIPDDATGTLGLVRKVCKVLGLYISSRITSGVTVNDTARVVAGVSPKSSLGSSGSVLRSPELVGLAAIFLGIAALFATGCTPLQLESATSAVCQSVPLAQNALNSATQTGRVALAQRILDRVNTACPGILLALDLSHAIKLGVKVAK